MVTEKEVESFVENGAVLLRNVFSEPWLDTISRGIQDNLKKPSPFSERLRTPQGNGGFFFNDYCNWQNIPEFRDLARHSPAAEIACRLMRSKVRELESNCA